MTGTMLTGEGGKNPRSHQLTHRLRHVVKPVMRIRSVSRTRTIRQAIASLSQLCG